MNNNSPKVIFRTFAHNAEKTIARTIESVLAQTYGNLELHLVDNGSTDNTGGIMEEYRKMDSRIRVFTNEENYVWKKGNLFTDYYQQYDIAKDYVCFIDADDEYKPDFLEKMVPFAEENSLDIACCGNDLVSEETGEVISTGKADDAFFIDGEDFCLLFPQYYSYICTRWAKIFRLCVTDRLDLGRIFWMYHREDFVEMVEHFRNADRIGIYPGAFYKWYCSEQSLSYRWDKRRIETDRVVFDLAIDYLIDKAGRVTSLNYICLCESYFGALSSTLRLLFNADTSIDERIDTLHDMFLNRHTRRAAAFSSATYDSSEKKKLLTYITDWLFVNEEKLLSHGEAEKVSDILSAVGTLSEGASDTLQSAVMAVLSENAGSVLEISGFGSHFGEMMKKSAGQYARDEAQGMKIDRIDLTDGGATLGGTPDFGGVYGNVFGSEVLMCHSELREESRPPRQLDTRSDAAIHPKQTDQPTIKHYDVIVVFHLFENMVNADAKALLEALLTRANKQVLVITPEYPYDLQSEDENKKSDVRAYHPAFFLGMDFSYKMMNTREGKMQAYSFFPKVN